MLRIIYFFILPIFLIACSGDGTDTSNVNVSISPQPNPINTQSPTLLFSLDFDEPTSTPWLLDSVSKQTFPIVTQGYLRESVPGVDELAWRVNGHTNWFTVDKHFEDTQTLTIKFWIALESYPADIETPYENLQPSAFISQIDDTSGFSIDINTYGQWQVNAFIDNQKISVKVPTLFPLYKWVQIAVVFDGVKGELGVVLNDQIVAKKSVKVGSKLNFSDTPLSIAKGNNDRQVGPLLINAINGVYDKLSIQNEVLSYSNISDSYYRLISIASTAEEAIAVPKDRFSQDLHRPRLHAMPPANWTNEPHGLVQIDGIYHMFYQRTSNLPYKSQMQWGHMLSEDLVSWKNTQNALVPSVSENNFGYDMKGIWSGDVWHDGSQTFAFYTSVNHGNNFNPGISMALNNEHDLLQWEKLGPILDSQGTLDFRDPYVFEDMQGYHMIIGAAYSDGGGLIHYTSKNLRDWEISGDFTTIPYAQMDIGSSIWEMPVFVKLSNTKYLLSVTPIGSKVVGDSTINPVRSVYWIGSWDGNQFTPDFSQPKNLDLVHGMLSPTVTKTDDGRIAAIGIVDEKRNSHEQFAAGWTQTFSLAREWYLMPSGTSIGQSPVQELTSLRGSLVDSNTNVLVNNEIFVAAGRQLEIELEIDPSNLPKYFGFILGTNDEKNEETLLTYDNVNNEFHVDTRRSSLNTNVFKQKRTGTIDLPTYGKPYNFRLFIDHSNVDVFINNSLAFSFRMYPSLIDSDQTRFFVSDPTKVIALSVWELMSTEQTPTKYSEPVSINQIAQGVKLPLGSFDQVIGDFDDALSMLQEGWFTTGDFRQPTNSNSWAGTSAVTKIGINAVSTCEINNNEKGCDSPTGMFVSPLFKVNEKNPFLSLLMSGGDGTDDIRLELVDNVSNKILLKYSPNNCTPSFIDGNDDWVNFDLSEYIGRQLQIRIIDQHTKGCGFVSFDHIHLRETPI